MFRSLFRVRPKALLVHRTLTPLRTEAHYRQLHISVRCSALPPPWLLIAAAGRKVARIGAVLLGRAFRKWYQALPEERQRQLYERWQANRRCLQVAGVVSLAGFTVYYATHLERTPITGRWRFVTLTHSQYMKVAQYEREVFLHSFSDKVLTELQDRRVALVKNIGRRLLKANADLPNIRDHEWEIFVIDSPKVNAMVLPTGTIFVLTGLLDTMTNVPDQLGIVLAHEMAHTVIGHGVEMYSRTRLIDWAVIISMAAIWALIFSDGIAAITTWFYNLCVEATVNLPYSRKLEREADRVGLEIAAKACIDVREAPTYWRDMDTRTKIGDQPRQPPDVISTHPSHGERAERINEYIDQALKIRAECNCPPLPRRDPRVDSVLRAAAADERLINAGKL